MPDLPTLTLPDHDLTGLRFFERLSARQKENRPLAQGQRDWGDFILAPAIEPVIRSFESVRQAAVLFGLVVTDEGLSLLLVKRSDHLRAHPGQVALPGGKIEEGENPSQTALREAWEEIALDPVHVTLLGALPSYQTGSAYCIHPQLALIDSRASMAPDGVEIDDLFLVPLHYLFNPSHHQLLSRPWRGYERAYLSIPHERHTIWGITAGIIHMVYKEVFVS